MIDPKLKLIYCPEVLLVGICFKTFLCINTINEDEHYPNMR